MAKVALVLDDVVLALKKGRRTVAEEKVSLNIPATVSSTEKRRNLRLDISDEGQKLLDAAYEERDKAVEAAKADYEAALTKLEEDRLKAEKSAWKELNKIADKVEEMRPSRKKKNEVEAESETTPVADSDSSAAPDTESGDNGATDTPASYQDGSVQQPPAQQFNGGWNN